VSENRGSDQVNTTETEALKGVQLRLPLAPATPSIEEGIGSAMRRAWRRRFRHRAKPASQASAATGQLNLNLIAVEKARKNRRAMYPIEMVEEARKMRRWKFTYREIAESLNEHFKTNVSCITIRDWTCFYYRMKK